MRQENDERNSYFKRCASHISIWAYRKENHKNTRRMSGSMQRPVLYRMWSAPPHITIPIATTRQNINTIFICVDKFQAQIVLFLQLSPLCISFVSSSFLHFRKTWLLVYLLMSFNVCVSSEVALFLSFTQFLHIQG